MAYWFHLVYDLLRPNCLVLYNQICHGEKRALLLQSNVNVSKKYRCQSSDFVRIKIKLSDLSLDKFSEICTFQPLKVFKIIGVVFNSRCSSDVCDEVVNFLSPSLQCLPLDREKVELLFEFINTSQTMSSPDFFGCMRMFFCQIEMF